MDTNRHNISLENRKRVFVDGVDEVISFDEYSVYMNTSLGRLLINGEQLHIQTLCLEKGNVVVDGEINEIIYESDQKNAKKGIFGRLSK